MDFLNISYDASPKDMSVICVTRHTVETTTVLKCLVGDKADELYKLLKNQSLDFELDVVHCKDCKAAEMHEDGDYGFCEYHDSVCFKNDYCNYGVRKE